MPALRETATLTSWPDLSGEGLGMVNFRGMPGSDYSDSWYPWGAHPCHEDFLPVPGHKVGLRQGYSSGEAVGPRDTALNLVAASPVLPATESFGCRVGVRGGQV